MADVKLNLAAVNQIMASPQMQSVVNDIGRRVAANAGDGFEYVARPHRWTARGYVQPTTARARRQQAREATLERALGAVSR